MLVKDAMLARTDPLMRLPDPQALLLQQAAAGDAAAFARLAEEITRPSLALAIRVLGDPALAEDAVQEALTRLWREADRYDPSRGAFGAWWRRILMNAALDGRRRLRLAMPLEDVASVADGAAGPAEAAEQAEVARQVQAAMAHLPARQRAALALFHGEGHRMAEIADILETSEKAVEGLLLRGRAALRNALGDMDQEGTD